MGRLRRCHISLASSRTIQYAPVRGFAPPCIRLLLDGQGFQRINAMTENTPAIRVEGLTRRFGDLIAVDRLTFSVNRGELFGLVGPDGAGKTTTLRMLAGVLRPSAGDAIMDGVSVVQHPERVKHDIAYMSQQFGLYTDLTVLENLHFYADLYQVPKSERVPRMNRLFQFSNLEPFKDRLAGH